MDQSTFTKLTGISLSASQSARFETAANLSAEQVQELLGWPLDPNDWENQYIEIGKTKDEWWDCPVVDTSDLLPPDPVIGATRLYTWNPFESYLSIDPATTIHALKLVRNGVTYKTFNTNEYSLRDQNSFNGPWGKYVQIRDDVHRWMLALWPMPDIHELFALERRADGDHVQVAIDADWAFDELPGTLQTAWAEVTNYNLDTKRDVKTESILSLSYSRNPHPDPTLRYASTFRKYAGPRGSAYPVGVIV